MLRSPTSELSIRPKWSKNKKITIASVLALVVVLLVLGTYRYGYVNSTGHGENYRAAISELRQELRKNQGMVKELKQQLAVAERKKQVQSEAYSEVNKAYQKVEQRNEFLNRRVNFYRSIISPEDGASGVKIHDVRSKKDDAGELQFEIVLIQSINHEKRAEVNLVVELYESKQSKQVVKTWPNSGGKFLQFRYSDVVKGKMQFDKLKPGMFLKVMARPDNSQAKQKVEWHEL